LTGHLTGHLTGQMTGEVATLMRPAGEGRGRGVREGRWVGGVEFGHVKCVGREPNA
jgi:hypothetical protein